MATAIEELSKRLHEVLNVVGGSENVRKKFWETAMLTGISFAFESQFYGITCNKMSGYQVGSSCEGTNTSGLTSDVDNILCYEDNPVVENLLESNQEEMSYLIVTDEFTKPGYVRLQIIRNKLPQSVKTYTTLEGDRYEIDWKGRVCAKHFKLDLNSNTIRNGPADTIPATPYSCQSDFVSALKCRRIPISANSWIYRTRNYNWPSQIQLEAMGSYGCFLVGVGHPHSDTSIEWRISFSLQERDLMSSLNETQHKCYILLKMIKKDIIESKAGESISSYHCKTSLFYTIENSQRHFWTDDKLILCTLQCLKRLFIWVNAKNCPNYFIPEENMFDKLSQMTLKNVENVLFDIIYSGVNFLYSITCDNVGELLKSKTCCSELECRVIKKCTMLNIDSPISRAYIFNAERVYDVRNELLQSMPMMCYTYTGYLNWTKQILLYLENTNHIPDHNTRDVRMTFDSIIPHIKLQYQQSMYSLYVSRGDISRLQSKTIQRIISKNIECDMFSANLSLASLCIQSEQLEKDCKRILASCQNKLKPYVISVCQCDSDRHGWVNTALADKLQFTDMSSKHFRRNYTTGCMVFHPSQYSLVPKALHYELFGDAYVKPCSLGTSNSRFNWINVDSHIYLYFLQYLLSSKTEKQTEKGIAVFQLVRVMIMDRNLGHRETGLNLLGWMLVQENDLRENAWSFFCSSWKFRPFKNAAKWHMLILLSEILKERKGS